MGIRGWGSGIRLMKKTALLVTLVGALSAALSAEILEQVLVKVNGEIITKTEFEARQVAELRNRPELANASPASPEPVCASAVHCLSTEIPDCAASEPDPS